MIDLNTITSVAVGSKNPVKIEAVRKTLSFYLDHDIEVVGLGAPSGVSDMPMSLVETEQGAYNRAKRCMEQGAYDMAFGLEGGVYFQTNILGDEVCYITGDVAICDATGYANIGRGPSFVLPGFVSKELRAGVELGPIMDTYIGQKNSKQKGGTVGYLTGYHTDRTKAFENIIVQALVPRLHPDLYLDSHS